MMCAAMSEEAMDAVECLMNDAIEHEIEEIKGLMEEMDIDSMEVELEVEVEVDEDDCIDYTDDEEYVTERSGSADSALVEDEDDSDTSLMGYHGNGGSLSESASSSASSSACVSDSEEYSSEDSEGSSRGDSDESLLNSSCEQIGEDAADREEAGRSRRRKGVTFSEDVQIVYIEACNEGRKVAELMAPTRNKKQKATPPTPTKTYRLRGKDGPVFVELTEEAAAYLKFIQISREHGINIVVKDFYQESMDFARGKLPESVAAAQQPEVGTATPVKADRRTQDAGKTPGRRKRAGKAKPDIAPAYEADHVEYDAAPSPSQYESVEHGGVHYFYQPETDMSGSYSFTSAPAAGSQYNSYDWHKEATLSNQKARNQPSNAAYHSYTTQPATNLDSPYQNNYSQAHRPMRGRGKGQFSRQYQPSPPYRKQQQRTASSRK